MGVRHGLYDWLTLEGHGEEVAGLYNAGAGVLARTGNFGILSVAASSSRYQGQPGFQAYLSCETKIWGVSLSASSTRTREPRSRSARVFIGIPAEPCRGAPRWASIRSVAPGPAGADFDRLRPRAGAEYAFARHLRTPS